jgi:anti-sigma B factor antagonist
MSLAKLVEEYNAARAEAPVGIQAGTGGDIVLSLSGELDMRSSSALAPVLDSAIELLPEGGRLVLDLSGVNYIASMGVGFLANAMVKAQRRKAELILRDIAPRVRSVMESLGLLSYFNVIEGGAGRG